ncbi:MAG TPA: YcaO-related McrA-glycine thioamidation protein [Methanoculleus sp.]|nr:YcaO-related McrA-glycine thioamidation protein [Methanoculleus sp.]
MKLSSCIKGYQIETHRTVSPEETLCRVEPLVPLSGITRVADITRLDRIGIPVFSCIRPEAATGAISVYNGKGATPVAARVSAIMEGIERYSAEPLDRAVVKGTFAELSEGSSAVFPGDLILPAYADPGASLEWVRGYDIMQDEEVFVPTHAVFHPVAHGSIRLFRTSTNGIASGNTLEEAVFHALSEVVERDAWSLVEASGRAGPVIAEIDDPRCSRILAAFESAGVEVLVRDITSDIGIPTIAAIADDVTLRDPTLLVTGMGTHTCPEIATLRALTEVAQSRATQIHGAREDTTEGDMRRVLGYDRMKRLNKKWFAADETIAFGDLLSFRSEDFMDDIAFTLDRLAERGLDRCIVVDLTREEIGVPVVRVIVPGLEVYAMDNERAGERCRRARRGYLPGSKS